MRRAKTGTTTAIMITCLAMAACGSDNKPGTGGTGGGGSGGSGGSGGQGGGQGGSSGKGGQSGGGGGTPEDRPKEMREAPEPNPLARRLTDERVTLVSANGDESCTNGPEPGDTWCAFFKPGETIGTSELWAINITGAAAALVGKPDSDLVQCKGAGDANCIRLSDDFYTADDDRMLHGYYYTGFFRRTLVMHTDPTSGMGDRFVGNVKAWRPGWKAPHQLSTVGKGYRCAVTSSGTYSFCLDSIDDTVMGKLAFNYLAGPLMDGGTTLTLQENIECCDDVSGRQKYSAVITPDDKWFVWSKRGAGFPTNKIHEYFYKPTSALGTTGGGSAWLQNIGPVRFPPGATTSKVLHFRAGTYTYDNTDPGLSTGELVVSDFPSGTPVTVAMGVGPLGVLADPDNTVWKGLAYLNNLKDNKWDFSLARNTANLAGSSTLISAAGCGLTDFNTDYTHVAFAKECAASGRNIFTQKLDASGAKVGPECMVTGSTMATTFGLDSITDDGKWMYWADNYDTTVGIGDAKLTNLDTCTTSDVGTTPPPGFTSPLNKAVWIWYPMANDGFIDNTDSDGIDATIRLVDLRKGAIPDAPAVLQKDAMVTFSLPLPDRKQLVYTIGKNSPVVDGLWYYRRDGASLFPPQ